MTETVGFAGLAMNRTVAIAVSRYRAVNFVAGTKTLMPHAGTGRGLGIVMQNGNPGDIVQVLEYGQATGEFDNTPVVGHIAGLNGDKAHDLGVSTISAVSTALGIFGGIRALRPDIGALFADFLVLGPASNGDQIQYADVVGTPAAQQKGTAVLDFGFSGGGEGGTALVTVSAAWVTAGSFIGIQAAGISSADHDPQDAILEGIIASVTNIIPGVSFDIQAYAVNDTWGNYTVQYSGV